VNRRRSPDGDSRSRVFVLGLDGFPCSYLRTETDAGRLPNFRALVAEGSLVPMRSSVPSVSSTAWTTFFTGHDAGAHGVFGFMDCRPESHDFYFPNLDHVRTPAIWDVLADKGKRSVVLNVPGTYPARPLRGTLVSGFVAPSLERAVHPPELLARLRHLGYRIDLDAWSSRASFERLEEDLFGTFDGRTAAIRMLLAEEDWDLFVGVVTETDRLYHFHWNDMEAGEPRVVDLFHRFHEAIDRFLGWLVEALPAGVELVLMSDHGFTKERVDVSTNAWLRERGYLAFQEDVPKNLSSIDPRSTVYSLAPGRFYVNRAGARPRGSVPPDQVPAVLERLVADLRGFKDPETGELVYQDLLLRDDVYHGAQRESGPDVVLTLRPGYELKASTGATEVFGPPANGLAGMHSSDDALLFVRGAALRPGPYELHDLAPTVASLLGIDPAGFLGTSLLASTDPTVRVHDMDDQKRLQGAKTQ
jgi:predicted AlkP superfamily phosphohydrolase/phosphomutase